MRKDSFEKFKVTTLLTILIIIAVAISLLLFKFINLIYDHFKIIASTATDNSEDESVLHLLGYFQIIISLTAGVFISRFILKIARRENINPEEKLVFKWILLGSFISFIPAGVLEQILLNEYGY